MSIVTAVLVNYQTEDLLPAVVGSLLTNESLAEIVIVDNSDSARIQAKGSRTTMGTSQPGASARPVVQFCLARTRLLHSQLCAQASRAR